MARRSRNNIIGKWAAHIIPVPKGDGKMQLCNDCKVTINQSLEVNQYPLPKPEDLFVFLIEGVII